MLCFAPRFFLAISIIGFILDTSSFAQALAVYIPQMLVAGFLLGEHLPSSETLVVDIPDG